jgi:hypothetical protein
MFKITSQEKKFILKHRTVGKEKISIFKNKEDGIEAHIRPTLNNGIMKYYVSLKDTDENAFIGVSKIFNNEKDAIKYAKLLVKK